jgi:hypothetical protein
MCCCFSKSHPTVLVLKLNKPQVLEEYQEFNLEFTANTTDKSKKSEFDEIDSSLVLNLKWKYKNSYIGFHLAKGLFFEFIS